MKNLFNFLNDSRKKYIALAIAAVILAGLIFACAKIGVTVNRPTNNTKPSNESNHYVEDSSDDFEESSNDFEDPESEEYTLDLPTQFVPFECSGDYYSFGSPKNQYGFAFEHQYPGNKLVYIHNNEENVLFETDTPIGGVSFLMCAYIDNYLFINVYQNNVDTLYRIAFEYDSDGNIKSHDIYFVAEDVYRPVKALHNALIIEKGYYGEYVTLDTVTGEINPIEYNHEVDSSSVIVSVSSDEAIKIAEKELEKDKYRIVHESEYDYVTDMDFPAPVLIHDPDIVYHKGYMDHIYEEYPEYVWVVRYNSEPLYQNVRIYINAMSGEISYVQIQPYP